MLPISELVEVAETLDDQGSSPIALLLGEAWGCDGSRFVRSSANHVFSCGGSLVLRFRPEWAAAGMEEAAVHARRLAGEGAAAASPVPALDGSLVARREGYAAHAVERVCGTELDPAELTPPLARRWGRTLALLHRAGCQSESVSLPFWLDSVRAADDSIADELESLPAGAGVFGPVHGDPELDNVVWRSEDEPVFVDLDDAAHSWLAADVSFALRDFAGPAQAPDPAREPAASFVAGYREIRPLTDQELSWLPLFARAHAAITAARLRDALEEPVEPSWPEWAVALRERIEFVAERLETALVAGTRSR